MNVQILTELPFVVLRPLKVEDAENLFRLVNENREYLRKWLPWLDETESQSDQLKFVQTCSECAAAGTQFHYSILVHGEIAGLVSFNNIEKRNRCATIGYWLTRSQAGRGIMTTAVKSLIAAGFEHLGLNRIQARVATGNRQSQAVCERAGLKAEGVLRQAEWLYDHYVDLTMNGMLRSEWRK